MPAISRGHYHEARFKIAPGDYRTIYDENGKPVRYATKKLAQAACLEAEIEYRLLGTVGSVAVARSVSPPAAPAVSAAPSMSVVPYTMPSIPDPGDQRFEEYAEGWLDDQDLADSTVCNYESYIQCHLLPTFGPMPLKDITRKAVAEWEKALRAAGYARDSITSYRAVLHVILEDAVEAGKIPVNTARRRRNRGRRAGRRSNRATEKVITDALGALLIAERAALLSGRDDEFVAVILKFYTGMRLGELVGLEARYVTDHRVRVEWQLTEIAGKLVKCEPKNGSRRDIHLPDPLWRLLVGFMERTPRPPCDCHQLSYVFRGQAKRRSRRSASGVTQRMLADRAEVTLSTVSLVLRGCANVSDLTRQRVLRAVAELGYTKPSAGAGAGHWRRSGFYAWLYTPAVSGWYPPRGKNSPARPVPVSAKDFPGVPVRGRNASGRADACWMPIANGMTPHGNRHSHRTLMEELGTPQKLINARIGHEDSSVQSRYTHVTKTMVDKLMDDLTRVWTDALDRRLAMSHRSPVAVLNGLLLERAERLRQDDLATAA
ncbi:LacI family DNA-binding transcriptional regulator [Nocardia sp. alder85J]|uniref:LacI family DNA-binding transcriptional regulator n=1 Tax=Nocardia sp. alder85J TaxID=2862949 RepID=UPI001CD79BCC|nr:LacI family DNA-binding transcriptional regulator [Nocardia sp. alder85J]MCX4093618.1 LacI family DNA-binding transcriptional regulator [Nocardia sp. alder85J]